MWAIVPITGKTNASFSHTSTVSGVMQAGTWESQDNSGCSDNHGHGDCSKLKFTGERFDGQKIYVSLKNSGADMKTSGKYEIYFIEESNPKNGSKISETLPFKPIFKDQELLLSFTPTKSGFYMFKMIDEDHPGKGVHELWSGKIEVRTKDKINSLNEIHENSNTEKQEKTNISIEYNSESRKVQNEFLKKV